MKPTAKFGMPRLPIIQEPHKTLRKKARELAPDEIKSGKIQKLIRDMSETLRAIEVGVGLAAPQVGKSLRIFLVSQETLSLRRDRDKLDVNELKKSKREREWTYLVFINPKIIKTSKKKNLLAEGCLSVSDPAGKLVYGQVERFEKLTVEARDQTGKKFTRGASELFAQVIQHEFDHLEGILFIDKAREIKTIDASAKNGAGKD